MGGSKHASARHSSSKIPALSVTAWMPSLGHRVEESEDENRLKEALSKVERPPYWFNDVVYILRRHASAMDWGVRRPVGLGKVIHHNSTSARGWGSRLSNWGGFN